MSRIDRSIATRFYDVQANLRKYLDYYGISISHLVRNTDIPRTTFERKLRNKSFTAEELLKIIDVINR